jgi:hypothetical protein
MDPYTLFVISTRWHLYSPGYHYEMTLIFSWLSVRDDPYTLLVISTRWPLYSLGYQNEMTLIFSWLSVRDDPYIFLVIRTRWPLYSLGYQNEMTLIPVIHVPRLPWIIVILHLIGWLFTVLHFTRKPFTHMETSLSPLKGCKILAYVRCCGPLNKENLYRATGPRFFPCMASVGQHGLVTKHLHL